MIITIDGPTASGKSTVARLVAHHFKYYYICSGLLYRALAHILLTKYNYTQQQIAHPCAHDVKEILYNKNFVYTYTPTAFEDVIFYGQSLGTICKKPLIDQLSSIVSADPYVRKEIDLFQQTLAQKHDIVTDGRDTGSVVFANAQYKFFLTALLEIRAQRWRLTHKEKTNIYALPDAITYIQTRDMRDSTRTHAPLIIPVGAHVIDNSYFSLEQTVQEIINTIKM